MIPRDEILSMAREAGMTKLMGQTFHGHAMTPDVLVRFAELAVTRHLAHTPPHPAFTREPMSHPAPASLPLAIAFGVVAMHILIAVLYAVTLWLSLVAYLLIIDGPWQSALLAARCSFPVAWWRCSYWTQPCWVCDGCGATVAPIDRGA